MDPTANIGDVANWIRTGGILGILAVLVGLGQLWLRKRKEDRDGWGTLITALQLDVDNVRKQAATDAETADRRAKMAKDDYATLRGQHKECERRLNEVEAQLRGVHKQFVLLSSSRVIPPGVPSDHVVEAARRAVDIVNRSDLPPPEDE